MPAPWPEPFAIKELTVLDPVSRQGDGMRMLWWC
ncbi:hypothetical protein AGROH133_10640 [Agrobacterium tumefaciens]|nr:hypothetical protein AGROH133_10640 [Agrobacterium tumefaciens]